MKEGASPKELVLDLLKRLDEGATFEEIQYRVHVLQKIYKGLQEAKEGKTITHEEVRDRLKND
jgi:predicted transcriptional regulator